MVLLLEIVEGIPMANLQTKTGKEDKAKSEWVDFKEIKEKVSMEDILRHCGLLKGLRRKENELVGYLSHS